MGKHVCFESLSDEWVASAWRLSLQAGWNQTEEDWRRLHRLNPDSVRVWCDRDEVRAAYSVVTYPPGIAWIGMILVDNDYRGCGLGKAAFEAALVKCDALGCKDIGLDATDLGEPIYLKYNFKVVTPITRWGGRLRLEDHQQKDAVEIADELSPQLLDLDHRVTGVDRSLLLKDLIRTGGTFLQTRQAASPQAYGVLREGRTAVHLGPVIAETPQSFRQIIAAVSSLLRGRELICDVLSRPEVEEELLAAGLRPLRHLKRMTFLQPCMTLTHSSICCIAGFELG